MGNAQRKFQEAFGKEEKNEHPLEPFSVFTDLYDTCPWDQSHVRKLVTSGALAPIVKGIESADAAKDESIWQECPICFLHNSQLNLASCCKQAVCTECFLQVRPPRKVTPCPFCNHHQFNAKARSDLNPVVAVSTPGRGRTSSEGGSEPSRRLSAPARLASSPKPIARRSTSAGEASTPASHSPPVASSSERRELEASMRSQRVKTSMSDVMGKDRAMSADEYRRGSGGGGGGGGGGRRRLSAHGTSQRRRAHTEAAQGRRSPGSGGRAGERLGALGQLLDANGGTFPTSLQQMEDLMLMEAIRESLVIDNTAPKAEESEEPSATAGAAEAAAAAAAAAATDPSSDSGTRNSASPNEDEGHESSFPLPPPAPMRQAVQAADDSNPLVEDDLLGRGERGGDRAASEEASEEEGFGDGEDLESLGGLLADEEEQMRLAIAMSMQESPSPAQSPSLAPPLPPRRSASADEGHGGGGGGDSYDARGDGEEVDFNDPLHDETTQLGEDGGQCGDESLVFGDLDLGTTEDGTEHSSNVVVGMGGGERRVAELHIGGSGSGSGGVQSGDHACSGGGGDEIASVGNRSHGEIGEPGMLLQPGNREGGDQEKTNGGNGDVDAVDPQLVAELELGGVGPAAVRAWGPQLRELKAMGFGPGEEAAEGLLVGSSGVDTSFWPFAVSLLERYQGRLVRVVNALSDHTLEQTAVAEPLPATPPENAAAAVSTAASEDASTQDAIDVGAKAVSIENQSSGDAQELIPPDDDVSTNTEDNTNGKTVLSDDVVESETVGEAEQGGTNGSTAGITHHRSGIIGITGSANGAESAPSQEGAAEGTAEKKAPAATTT